MRATIRTLVGLTAAFHAGCGLIGFDTSGSDLGPSADAGELAGRTLVLGPINACRLTAAGELTCAGHNDNAQITTPSSPYAWLDSDVFVPRDGLPGPVSQVAIGDHFGCGLLDGAVWCWGNGTWGQLGPAGESLVPVARPLPGAARGLVAGNWHACALGAGGEVWCWGQGFNGQTGPTPSAPSAANPVPGLTDVVELSAADRHSCARMADGQQACWGSNGDGSLGDGTYADSATPVFALRSDDGQRLAGVLDQAAAGAQTCALLGDGAVWCWGLGAPRAVLAGVVPGGRELAVGDYHACVLTSSGTVWCAGADDEGQRGDGPATAAGGFTEVPGLADITQLSASSEATCATSSRGASWCWGGNSFGQLGLGNTALYVLPTTVALPGAIRRIATNWGSTCAVTADGGLWCWGRGLLDLEPTMAGPQLRSPTPRSTGVSGVVDVDLGDSHGCVVVGGEVRCWGSTSEGQAPRGNDGRPVAVAGVPPGVTAVATTSRSTCALVGGNVWCWGDNQAGQVGIGSAEVVIPTPTMLGLTGVAELRGGSEHMCARESAGRVWCWGAGGYGQLGDGGFAERASPVPVAGLDDAIALATGWTHSCAVRADRSLWCWGDGSGGGLGQGLDESSRGVPVAVSLVSAVTTVSAGVNFTCAVQASGDGGCFGRNTDLQLGAGPRALAAGLVPLVRPSATLVDANFHHACAGDDGGLTCWGTGYWGQLGNGVDGRQLAPAPLP